MLIFMRINYATTLTTSHLPAPLESAEWTKPCFTRFTLGRNCWDRFWNTWAHGHTSIFVSRGHIKAGNEVKWWSNQFSECVPYHHRTYLFTPDTSRGLNSLSLMNFDCVSTLWDIKGWVPSKTSLDSLVKKNKTALLVTSMCLNTGLN